MSEWIFTVWFCFKCQIIWNFLFHNWLSVKIRFWLLENGLRTKNKKKRRKKRKKENTIFLLIFRNIFFHFFFLGLFCLFTGVVGIVCRLSIDDSTSNIYIRLMAIVKVYIHITYEPSIRYVYNIYCNNKCYGTMPQCKRQEETPTNTRWIELLIFTFSCTTHIRTTRPTEKWKKERNLHIYSIGV